VELARLLGDLLHGPSRSHAFAEALENLNVEAAASTTQGAPHHATDLIFMLRRSGHSAMLRGGSIFDQIEQAEFLSTHVGYTTELDLGNTNLSRHRQL
jgi:hypothetical protein